MISFTPFAAMIEPVIHRDKPEDMCQTKTNGSYTKERLHFLNTELERFRGF